MLAALAGERLPGPIAPAVAQPQPRELGHQVEFGRPHVAERDGPELSATAHNLYVVGACRLGGHVVDVVRPTDPRGGEVADGVAARFGLEPGDHGPRQVDAVHGYASAGQGQGDAAGSDAEFEGWAGADEVGEHVDGQVHDVGVEHLRLLVVAPGRYVLPAAR